MKEFIEEFIFVCKAFVFIVSLLLKALGPPILAYWICTLLVDMFPWYITIPIGILLILLGATVSSHLCRR